MGRQKRQKAVDAAIAGHGIDLQLRQVAEENLRWKMLLAVWCRREGKTIVVTKEEIQAVLATEGLSIEAVANPETQVWLVRVAAAEEDGPPAPPRKRRGRLEVPE